MIRPASIADIWALRRKAQRRIFFPNDALLASSYHPYILALRAIFDPMGSDRTTLVLRDHGVRGYLQARRRPGKAEADLQFLTAYLPRARARLRDGDLFFRLIEDYVKRAGSDGIERIFATLGPRASEVNESLRQLGFQPYAQQSAWMLPEAAVEAGTAMVALRRQARRDAWAIHQLYTSVTPRHVQQAEPCDSTSWQLSRRQEWLRGPERAWVLGDDQALTVYMHLLTGSRGHVLRLMIAPHLRTEAATMVRYVLSQLHDRRPIFAVIRSYQSEFQGSLEELGFVHRGDQTIYVKQLAVLARRHVFMPSMLRATPVEGSMPAPTLAGLHRQSEAQ